MESAIFHSSLGGGAYSFLTRVRVGGGGGVVLLVIVVVFDDRRLGKSGHKAKDCRHKKEHEGGNSGGNSNQENHVESPTEFAGVIEAFLTTNDVDWWLDTGATKHICNSRKMFISYQKVNDT
ncbi:hypothetical protein CTI12_AA285840 [Artemisia annua]|uniref:Retrovirus-related Pol polyprotein from transposon TNT 1-94-like beta-barrel domain-containing protein n=1 Tax=Artemisia annua TaxID=35608 RepID=A0A2U1NBH7_ARTAN|nr:hypothetical protein CTI12_AA285840 [Artemisia annua]